MIYDKKRGLGSAFIISAITLASLVVVAFILFSQDDTDQIAQPPVVAPPENLSLHFYDELGGQSVSTKSISVGNCDLRPLAAKVQIGKQITFINDSSSKVKLFVAENNNPEEKRMIRDIEIEPQKSADISIDFRNGEGEYLYDCLVSGRGFKPGVIEAVK